MQNILRLNRWLNYSKNYKETESLALFSLGIIKLRNKLLRNLPLRHEPGNNITDYK